MTIAHTERLLTVEEYQRLPELDGHTELVRGRIVKSPFPGFRHGLVCADVGAEVDRFVDENDLGSVVNNVGVVTTRDPDSVRRADVAFYSYDRVPRRECPEGYPDNPPELVFDVLWHEDRWGTVLERLAEFLAVGVNCVVVLDTDRDTAHEYRHDGPPRMLQLADRIELPDILPGFVATVAELLHG